jgi:hypothetical protein
VTTFANVVIALGTAAAVLLLLRRPVRRYFAVRGDRVVSCPENNDVVAVRVDAVRAALGSVAGGSAWSLESCTRWPEKSGCGQECLKQIEAAPTDCLVRTKVARWYSDKTCALCATPLGSVDWSKHQPAVMTPSGRTLEWRDIRPETLPEVFNTHKGVCWDCHIAETFRRTRPDLVLDNPHPGQPRQ